jgi:hypothetical protein
MKDPRDYNPRVNTPLQEVGVWLAVAALLLFHFLPVLRVL